MAEHGTRRSYAAGCRCLACRAANAAAVRAYRAALPVGTVDASPVRAHLAALALLGVGHRTAARLAHLSASTVRRCRTAATVRPSTARRLLAVRPQLAHGATVAGTKTHRFIDSLQREGFTRREIGFRLGARSQQLQLGHRVRVSSALRVSALYATLAALP